jgi:site-specific recombinase XerD
MSEDRPDTADLPALLASWQLAMSAERKSPATIDSYVRSVKYYLRFCAHAHEPLDRKTLQLWLTHLLHTGLEANTARIRQQAVRRFASWLAEQDEIPADPFTGMKPPRIDAKVVEPLSEEDLRLMLKACRGKEMRDRRDEAVLRLMIDTGMRAGEVLSLDTVDVDLVRCQLVVRRGKGGKGRHVAFSAQTSAAIDRYLRVRRHHRYAASGALWLSKTGRPDRLSYHGLRLTLLHRAVTAGVTGFHIHRLRHTFATRWLSAGGTEGGLMASAGWSSRGMIDRYARSTASERAMNESRRLGLGDL